MLIKSAKAQRKGITRMSATIRGRTRNSTGATPNVSNALISSLTFIVPSWAAEDDARHDAPHLTDRGDSYQVSDIDGRSEPRQFGGPNERQNQPDEKINHRHNSQGLRAAFLHYQQGVRPAKLRATAKQVAQSDQVFTQEREHFQRASPSLDRTLTQLLQKLRFDGLVARIDSVWDSLGQAQQPSHTFWKPVVAKCDISRPG